MINNIVGYRILHSSGQYSGDSGIGYDYILARNGVYICASNKLISARIPISSYCHIRGLADEKPYIQLAHGKIPAVLFELALNTALNGKDKEMYMAVTCLEDGYHLYLTSQKGTGRDVTYERMPDTVCDIHSHIGKIGPFFSGQDDIDEQGLKFSVVLGYLDERFPVCRVRCGVYGYYFNILWSDLFVGDLHNCIDANATESSDDIILPEDISQEEKEEKNVELHIKHGLRQGHSGGGWWHRFMSHRRVM